MANKVVITGYGIISSLGETAEKTFEKIINKKSGIDKLTKINSDKLKCKLGAEVHLETTPEERRQLLYQTLAIRAAKQAIDMSRFDYSIHSEGAVFLGTGVGSGPLIENNAIDKKMQPDMTSPFYIPYALNDMGSGLISQKFKMHGPNMSLTTACASGANAIGEAFRLIRYGYINHALAGGAESTLTPFSISSFGNMRAMNTYANDTPEKSLTPFAKERKGFVMGEGAGFIFIESLESAQKRGATILGEILGYGSTSDSYHITAPHPDGKMAQAAMRMALNEAAIDHKKVCYINAHGTGTDLNDSIESKAISELFLDHKPFVSSIKNAVGHCIGAAGAIELIVSLLALNQDQYPLNFSTAEFDPEILKIANVTDPVSGGYALSNSFGFGGHNASLLIAGAQNV